MNSLSERGLLSLSNCSATHRIVLRRQAVVTQAPFLEYQNTSTIFILFYVFRLVYCFDTAVLSLLSLQIKHKGFPFTETQKYLCLFLLRNSTLSPLYIYWMSSREQPTRGSPPAWELGLGLTSPHRKNVMCYEMFQSASETVTFQRQSPR